MKRTITALFAAGAIAALGGVAAHAADVTINFAHVDPADWQTSKKGAAALIFKNIVEGETNGRIKVNLFDSGQLGGETDLMQSVKDGTLQMTMISGPFSQLCKEAAVLDLPYAFPSAPVAWKVLDGPFGEKLAATCLKETGVRVLAYGETGFRDFTNNKHPIKSPDDLAGLKVRVMTVPLFVKMVSAMKGEPTPISFPELPGALATGVVDGQENPVSVIVSNKLYDVQKYLTLDRHVYGVDFILAGDSFFKSLSPADQKIVKDAAIVAGNMGRSIQEFNSAAGVKTLIDKGMQVYQPTPEQMDAFRKAAQPPVEDWLKQQVGAEWVTGLLSAVKDAEKATAPQD